MDDSFYRAYRMKTTFCFSTDFFYSNHLFFGGPWNFHGFLGFNLYYRKFQVYITMQEIIQ